MNPNSPDDPKSCFLFVYGLLKPEYEPPATTSFWTIDTIKGVLWDLHTGQDAAVTDLGNPHHTVLGRTLIISREELPKLDKIEAPEYVRRQVRTHKGYMAYVYEYQNDVPKDAKIVSDWIRGK